MLILLSQYDLNANPLIDETFLKNINSDKDVTSCSITKDNSFFVFSRNDKKGYGSLYFTQYKNKKWDAVKPLTDLNSDFDDVSPYISPDGEFILFSSNRPGGLMNKFSTRQSYDMYYSERRGKDWTQPVLLYGTVNTEYDELHPFIARDGETLYFSRLIDYDNDLRTIIVKVKKVGDSWERTQTVEIAKNSNLDILMYKEAMYRSGAYIIAGEKNNRSHNKWVFYVDDANGKNITLIPLFEISGMDTYEIFVAELDKNKLIVTSNSDGKYKFFIRDVDLKKYANAEKIFNLEKSANNFSIEKDSNLERDFNNFNLEKDFNLEKKVEPSSEKDFFAKPIFFSYNSTDIDVTDIPYIHELIDLLRDNKNLKLDLNGYSDGVGSYKANIEISLKRAEKIKEYIVKFGIEKSRITTNGFGYLKDRINDTPQYNRRVDIILK